MPPRCRDPCGRRRDRRWRGEQRSCVKSLAQQGLQFVAIEVAETETIERAAAIREILAADRAAEGEKGKCQRRCDSSQFSDRNQKCQAEAQIFSHVAMF